MLNSQIKDRIRSVPRQKDAHWVKKGPLQPCTLMHTTARNPVCNSPAWAGLALVVATLAGRGAWQPQAIHVGFRD